MKVISIWPALSGVTCDRLFTPTSISCSVLIALLMLMTSQPVYANGESVSLDRKMGRYHVRIETSGPTAQIGVNYHLGISVVDNETGLEVDDAVIGITVAPPQELRHLRQIGPIPVPLTTQDKGLRHFDLLLPEKGIWTMTVIIEGAYGKASTELPVRVAAPGIPWGIVGVSASSIFLFMALTWTIFTRGRTPRARQGE